MVGVECSKAFTFESLSSGHAFSCCNYISLGAIWLCQCDTELEGELALCGVGSEELFTQELSWRVVRGRSHHCPLGLTIPDSQYCHWFLSFQSSVENKASPGQSSLEEWHRFAWLASKFPTGCITLLPCFLSVKCRFMGGGVNFGRQYCSL